MGNYKLLGCALTSVVLRIRIVDVIGNYLKAIHDSNLGGTGMRDCIHRNGVETAPPVLR